MHGYYSHYYKAVRKNTHNLKYLKYNYCFTCKLVADEYKDFKNVFM